MLSVDRPSTECRPVTIDQLSANYRRSVGEVSAKCRRSVGEVSVNEKLYRPRHIWNDYRTCLDRVSTHYRPTIDRLSTAMSTECRPSVDRVSTECRPSIDRLSTEYRPLYRPISRSTLPTVNKIHKHLESLPGTSSQIFDWKPCQTLFLYLFGGIRLSPKQARRVNQRLAYH